MNKIKTSVYEEMGFFCEEIHFLFFGFLRHPHEYKINFFTSESIAIRACCLFIFKNLKTGTAFATIYVQSNLHKAI